MASLSDRLDYVVGAKAAESLDEVFGIRTVDDLLRHYPRSYTEGAAVLGCRRRAARRGPAHHPRRHDHRYGLVSDEEAPEARMPHRITLGSGRSKVTATFFNADYIMKDLTEDTKVMLSGEVGYFRNVMQLTHPAFLILDSPDGTQPRHPSR